MMKKSYLLLTAMLLLVATGARAQGFEIGVKGGLTIPNLTAGGNDTPLSEGFSSRLAWGAGVFGEYKFNNRFSLEVGLEYSGQGGQKDGMQALPAGPIQVNFTQQLIGYGVPAQQAGALAGFLPNDYMYANFDSEVKFDYLMLPVMGKVGWNFTRTSPFRVYVSAGLFASYLMNAERVSKSANGMFADKAGTALAQYVASNPGFSALDPATQGLLQQAVGGMGAAEIPGFTQDITDEIYRFNFGVIAHVGISYQMCPRHKLFIEGGGNYGFKKIQKDGANGQNRIGAGTVMLGYSFAL